MLVDSIKSPKSGRWIQVRGQAYADLMGTRYETKARRARRYKRQAPGSKTRQRGKVTSARRISSLPRAKPRSLEATLRTVPKSRRARRRVLKSQIARRGEGRGSRTRGWAAAAPQRGRERHALLKECGDKCFLIPERQAFPVCAALREKQGCSVDCRGVTSALVRARQWKYPQVSAQARRLQDIYDCKAPARPKSRKAPRKKTPRRRTPKRAAARKAVRRMAQ